MASNLPAKLSTVDLLFNAAINLGLQPNWIVPDGLFVVKTDYGESYINRARSTLNSHSSSSLAKNKYLTRLILERNSLPNIPFLSPGTIEQAVDFLNTHKTIIVKPINGEGSQDINIVNDPADLIAFDVNKYIFEKYVAGKELRYLVLNNKVIAVHESEYGESVAEDRELERISYQKTDWDTELIEHSLKIATLFDLNFAAIDYLIDQDGVPYVLEVNTSPGLKWFHSPSVGPSVDVASLFLKAMLSNQHIEKRVP